MLTDEKVKQLSLQANAVRTSLLEALVATKTDKYAASGHTAGPLGMADIFTYFYFHGMRHDPQRPDWTERDRFILSNGHICPVLYATMAHAGYFPLEELKTLRHFGSRLQGHPHREFLPMVETSSGPLGSGLSQAAGMALADRIDFGHTSHRRFYTFLSDGELQEGNIWEAVMFAGKYKLHNLVAVIDYNNIQIEGYVTDIMPLEPLADKWKSFNWHVLEVDGHDFRQIDQAVEEAKAIFEKPTVIIAHTIPGKGVSFMEREFSWHGKPPKPDEAEKAFAELRAEREKLAA